MVSGLSSRGLARPRGSEIPEGLREIARRGALEAQRKALAEVLERVGWNRADAAYSQDQLQDPSQPDRRSWYHKP
jgi:hypothetical protein